ncbi:nitric oxide reductase activation protein NorD (plasmid) [Rhizobium phaseoli]|uniref:Nitric oxide reductase activation protein NorD n=1 Tax=Rhizobium phaseoli TaxID=396 RepID=A0A192TI73_9HYPH|nr:MULTISPECIES: VWA domain-containing protein [Rhizobium]ANL30495.1 nitric oxide reductase activation protein NorD [Rhizobium phaseoli]ANL42921.1 nitric oxide reductase activation protein NorD [Rhizobium phaseoli]ANL55601.1 nitric oxide reductase activation protein NorD [Rhizobium phaseoli]ANL61907.1 nitric oxide reductase activation protein NorD [Rhizobium phaseoli]ANL87322.1 nitric oxide reductase activation protein NorD [Rhizobium phaseoli]
MLEFLELEETVGRAWHRLVGDTRSWPRHPQHAVKLADIRSQLSVCFRAFGGEPTLQIQKSRRQSSSHRLRFRQVVGLGEERSDHPTWDGSALHLPASIDIFDDERLNRDLYFWLAAYIAVACAPDRRADDAMLSDIGRIEAGRRTAARVVATFPGMHARYLRLSETILACRTRGRLPKAERQIEDYLRFALAFPLGDRLPDVIRPTAANAPPGYLPMLPVPIWPDFTGRAEAEKSDREDLPSEGSEAGPARPSHQAVRKKDADDRRRDPFILNRFEKILAMAEMVNVDRPTDDRDDDDAGAADELDEISLSESRERPKSKFRFDLDLSPEASDVSQIHGAFTYPEWDYRRKQYMADHCRVLPGTVPAAPQATVATDKAIVRAIRRQFETLRSKREIRKAQLDGNDLDLEAVIRARADLLATGQTDDRIYECARPASHELATSILVDVSLSTDSWVDNRRVLDVEKQALDVFARGLDACGDSFSIHTFTSRRRNWVRIDSIKEFEETFSQMTARRIADLKPGYYTRMGAALRHVSGQLHKHAARKKLLLILTDGKPNDVDHYEGRFALEDSRKAVAEARMLGQAVFAVTVDRNAGDYLPAIFGRAGFAVISELSKLPGALPAIYRNLTA